ncbi:hypothetical protein [Nocardia sp. alder85J]|uniref:hypothetical protein n=1 Tax=Nocardia sp. alder85J TaxID=2862949 RepID=UPI001CD2E435|nr:hypothetical protein [Nocardia sp. alder85J]MCX4091777.1 hypothetical protein [Nocardia sp. alder85J]
MVYPYPPGPPHNPGQPWSSTPGYPMPGHPVPGANPGDPRAVLGAITVGLAAVLYAVQAIWYLIGAHNVDWYLLPVALTVAFGLIGAVLVAVRPAAATGRTLAAVGAGAVFLQSGSSVINTLQYPEYQAFSRDGQWLFIPATIVGLVAVVVLALPAAKPPSAPAPAPLWQQAPSYPSNYAAPQPYPAPQQFPQPGYQPPGTPPPPQWPPQL